jgi:hypothetical protein
VQKLAQMSKKVTDTPLITSVRLSLFDIKKAVTFGPGVTPSAEDVQNLNKLAADVVKTISTKE